MLQNTSIKIFLKENPKWALNNKENLIKEQLVDENYLKILIK